MAHSRGLVCFPLTVMLLLAACSRGDDIISPENIDLTGTLGLTASRDDPPRILSCSDDLGDIDISFCDFFRLVIQQEGAIFVGDTDQDYCGRTISISGEFDSAAIHGTLVSVDDTYTSTISFNGLGFAHDVSQEHGFVTFYTVQILPQSMTIEGFEGSCSLAGVYD